MDKAEELAPCLLFKVVMEPPQFEIAGFEPPEIWPELVKFVITPPTVVTPATVAEIEPVLTRFETKAVDDTLIPLLLSGPIAE